jgi:hypothetical protein
MLSSVLADPPATGAQRPKEGELSRNNIYISGLRVSDE